MPFDSGEDRVAAVGASVVPVVFSEILLLRPDQFLPPRRAALVLRRAQSGLELLFGDQVAAADVEAVQDADVELIERDGPLDLQYVAWIFFILTVELVESEVVLFLPGIVRQSYLIQQLVPESSE